MWTLKNWEYAVIVISILFILVGIGLIITGIVKLATSTIADDIAVPFGYMGGGTASIIVGAIALFWLNDHRDKIRGKFLIHLEKEFSPLLDAEKN